MARAAMHGGRPEMALPLLEACFHAVPSRTDYAQVLARCQLQLGLLDEAEATIGRALESFGPTGRAELIRASIAIEKQDHAAALAALERAREQDPDDLQLWLMLAQSDAALRRWKEAEAAARRVLAADPHGPQARLLLARIHLQRRESVAAMQEALEAIGLQYGNPRGHLLLGAALVQLERWDEAEQALHNRLRLNPRSLLACGLLARVLRAVGEPEKARGVEADARLQQEIADPEPVLATLAEFLGGAFTNGPAAAACVKTQLHRHKAAGEDFIRSMAPPRGVPGS